MFSHESMDLNIDFDTWMLQLLQVVMFYLNKKQNLDPRNQSVRHDVMVLKVIGSINQYLLI